MRNAASDVPGYFIRVDFAASGWTERALLKAAQFVLTIKTFQCLYSRVGETTSAGSPLVLRFRYRVDSGRQNRRAAGCLSSCRYCFLSLDIWSGHPYRRLQSLSGTIVLTRFGAKTAAKGAKITLRPVKPATLTPEEALIC